MSNYMPAGARDEQHETGQIDVPPRDWLREQVNENRRLDGLEPQCQAPVDTATSDHNPALDGDDPASLTAYYPPIVSK